MSGAKDKDREMGAASFQTWQSQISNLLHFVANCGTVQIGVQTWVVSVLEVATVASASRPMLIWIVRYFGAGCDTVSVECSTPLHKSTQIGRKLVDI